MAVNENARLRWSDVGVNVQQCQGAIRMEMFGDADMAVYPPSQTAPETDPYLPISVHYPTELGESDDVADIRVSLSPETARELGEWLCEHADDDPDVVLDGDVDE